MINAEKFKETLCPDYDNCEDGKVVRLYKHTCEYKHKRFRRKFTSLVITVCGCIAKIAVGLLFAKALIALFPVVAPMMIDIILKLVQGLASAIV